MPAETKGKSIARMAPYRMIHRPPPLLPSVNITSNHPSGLGLAQTPTVTVGPLPLAANWEPSGQVLGECSDFTSLLSSYLKMKNEAFREEIRSVEEALTEAEETSKLVKEKAANLGRALDALEGTVTAATNILSSSLMCVVCLETCSDPTSLRCGHSFCRDCLQLWLLKKFEMKCDEYKIDLTDSQYNYIYTSASTAVEAELNMVKFAKLSNQLNPDYICPSCRDPLLPSSRNSFWDFKLGASLSTLNALIGYVPDRTPGWKLAAIDFLAFLNSSFYRRQIAEVIDLDI